MPARRITTSSERTALLPTSTGINTRNLDTPAGGAESCCHRRHVLTMFGFWACFCMEVSRNFSVVVIPMAKEFGWDHATVGAVFASSYYGYAPMQIPSGAIVHRCNRPTVQVFVCMMLLSALHTALPFVVRESGSPKVLYLLMVPLGITQALLNPSLHKLIASWSPVNERTRVHNSIYAGQNAGKMVSSLTSAFIVTSVLGWHWVFWSNAILCGAFGLLWIANVSDSPAVDPRISGAERDHIRLSVYADAGAPSAEEHPSFFSLPWRDILASVPFWAIVVNHFAYDWGSQTAASWVPQWLNQALDFDLKEAGLRAMLPQLASFIVVVLSGPLALRVLERRIVSVTTLRKAFQAMGLLIPGGLLLLLCWLDNITRDAALGLVVASVACGGLTYSGHHVNHIDLSPTYAPILYGATNTVANVASIVSPIVNGWLLGSLDRPDPASWHKVFLLSAVVQCVGGVVWLVAASGRKQPWG